MILIKNKLTSNNLEWNNMDNCQNFDDILQLLNNKTILITGGSGFIGSKIVQKLLANKSINIKLISRNQLNYSQDNIECIQCDLSNRDSFEILRGIGNFDYVIFLAAKMPDPLTSHNFEVNLKQNFLSVFNFVNGLPDHLSGFIFISSIDVYGYPVYNPIDEKHPTNPNTYYGASKLASEKFIKIALDKKQIPLTILRLSQVYGPGEPKLKAIPTFIDLMVNKKNPIIYGNGSDIRDYLYVDDAANAIIMATISNIPGVYNIGTGKGTSINNLIEIINTILGTKIKPVYKPRVKQEYGSIVEITLAKKTFGYQPCIEFPDGIKEQILWASRNIN
jgi:UDP-glucose 4-epimerase